MLAPSPPISQNHNHLGLALLVASIAHLLLILGISFDIDVPQLDQPAAGLDITIVHTRSNQEKPEDPEFFAQVSQQGGALEQGETAFTAPPSKQAVTPDRKAQAERQRVGTDDAQLEVQREVITTESDSWQAPKKEAAIPVKAPQKTDIAQLLASTQQEIQRLTAELDEQARNSANKKRRKAINASTQEFVYATYMDAWRKKVERIGNLNYPDEAKQKKIYGNLMLHVAVRKDGTVEGIRVVRSSGHKVLDDAAKRIVKLAAPYAAFPPEISKQVDVLDITRTWQFLDNNRLFSAD